MARWLFKSEPDCYSFADLERDGRTLWDGVTNALARKHLRQVQPGMTYSMFRTIRASIQAASSAGDSVGAATPSPIVRMARESMPRPLSKAT